MSFIDINNIERYTILVFPIQLIERGNLPAKRRSSVTTEHENDRLLTAKARQRYRA